MPTRINLLAVAASAVVSMGINFVWFTLLFRDAYIAGLGRTQAQLAAGPSLLEASLYQFAGFVVLALGLAWLLRRAGMVSVGRGVAFAFVCWVAFFASLVGPIYAYQAFSLAFFGIVAGGYLLSFLASGLIVAAWR